jgi:hypothetical protein
MKYKVFLAAICLIVTLSHSRIVFSQSNLIKHPSPTGKREIRKFDFLNATYEAQCADGKVRVRNGVYSPPDSAGFFFTFDVLVSYGDLTGDGVEEAVLVTQCDGAVQNYSEGKVYAVRGHRLERKASLEVGTKNNGDIVNARIKNQRLIVTRGPGPKRCPEQDGAAEEITTYKLQGRRLRQIGKPVCKAL